MAEQAPAPAPAASRRQIVEPGVVVLLACFLVLFPLLFKPWIHGADTIGYFSWLRSIVIDGDLQTADEFEHFGMGWLNTFAATGLRDNPGAVGSAVLWAPWFFLAHALTHLGRAFGLGWVADGYGQQYILAASLGSAVYALCGLLLTYRVARRTFSQRTATLAIIAVWLSSPLVFYMYSHPMMSHANDAFAYALLLFAWVRCRESGKLAGYVWMGLAAGLCALVRNQNAVLVVFPLAEMAHDVFRDARGGGLRAAMVRGLGRAAAFSFAWWLAFLPQLLVWRSVFGTWLPGNPYASSGGGTFAFLSPRIAGVLLSTNRGLFTWTPLILICVLGWIALRRLDSRLTAFVAVNFGLQVVITASWSSWAGSAAFGQRFFTNMAPAFALGLAAVLHFAESRIRFGWLVGACALFIAWNAVLLARYALEDVARVGPVDLDHLVFGQFTAVPRNLARLVQILLSRE